MTRPDPAPLLPVAGWRYLTPALAPHARAFDRFVTAARSIADEATWAPDRRRGVLEACAARLAGGGLGEAGAPALPEPLAEATQVLAVTLTATGIGADSARHVLQALQKETRGLWLRTWGELMVHGQYAAAPRGRFLAALMGERGRRLCRAAEALSVAAWVVERVRDCRNDLVAHGRLYLPEAWFREANVAVDKIDHGDDEALRAVLARGLDGAGRRT